MILATVVCIAALAAPSAPITAESVSAVLDPVFAKCSPETTPGASVAVVFNGEVILNRGYGMADADKGIAVDPKTHLFRAASISKLITATAVMQLVDQGKVNLDADVNGYLKSPVVPEAFLGVPITLRNLLQHAGGFDDEFLGMARRTPEELPTLAEYLATDLPKRVFPPGQFASYSNHGVALAGLVVEAVSGKSFAEYARENIFAPLGMEHSYFDLVPDASTPLATGYWRGLFGGPLQKAPYDYPCTVPASSLCTTSADMARFMLCQLGNGTLDGAKVLKPEAVVAMQSTGMHGVPGLALGFFERWNNGRRCINHTGLIWGYASKLLLYPEEKFGVYITLNSEDGELYDRATDALMDAFFPEVGPRDVFKLPALPLTVEQKAIDDGTRETITGTYRYTRYPRNSFLKFGLLVSGRVPEIEIRAGARPGVWEQRAFGTGEPRMLYGYKKYRYGKPGEKEDEAVLEPGPGAILLDKSYNPNRIDITIAPQPAQAFVYRSNAYERIQWWEGTWFLIYTALACVLVLLLWGPVRFALRLALRGQADNIYPFSDALRRSTRLAIWSLLFFLMGIGAILSGLPPLSVAYGPPAGMYPLLCLPLLALAAHVVALVGWFNAWRLGRGHLLERLHLTATLAAVSVLLLVLNYWNLVGFKMG